MIFEAFGARGVSGVVVSWCRKSGLHPSCMPLPLAEPHGQ